MIELAYYEKISLFVILLIIITVVTNVIGIFIQKILENKFSKHYLKLTSVIIQFSSIILLVYFLNVYYFKFEIGVIASSLGIVSVAIAFSTQQIIQNFISGLIISFGSYIKIDDWIEINPPSIIGRIKDINLMRITIRDINGKIHFIPNFLLITSRVINYNKTGFVEIQIPMAISSNNNFENIKKIIYEVLNKNLRILPNVSKNEKARIFKLLELKSLRRLYPEKDLTKWRYAELW